MDGRLRGSERSRIAAHLRKCDPCASHFEQIASLRSAARALPEAVPPPHLATALRVMASHERQVAERNHGSHWGAIWNRWKFRLDEMLRPLTIPATGGLLSSFILFGALAFTIGTTTRTVSYEVPVALYGSCGREPGSAAAWVGGCRSDDYYRQQWTYPRLRSSRRRGFLYRRSGQASVQQHCAAAVSERSRSSPPDQRRHSHLFHASRAAAVGHGASGTLRDWRARLARAKEESVKILLLAMVLGTASLTGPIGEGLCQGYDGEWSHVSKQLIALAEATPADKFAWRPAPGVRSMSEVYMHIATREFLFIECHQARRCLLTSSRTRWRKP